MIGSFAKSKAGHDKDHIYIIVKEEKEYVYLVDGKTKTLEHPKKKKHKHIQIIKKYADNAICKKLQESIPLRDEEIKRAIKLVSIKMKNSDDTSETIQISDLSSSIE